MHMADALVSPAVGATMWAISAAMIGRCSKRVSRRLDERKVPLMGVLGAFVFTAQMINFTIPATGSSGHLGGGLLLAILLGPSAAFLTIASVLMVQALFFADGGLLALGCNIFNLGFFPAFVACPLVYRKLIGRNPRKAQMLTAAVIAAVLSLQLGSLGVVLETVASGVSALPFKPFLLLMQSIHLAIGIVEGLVTALVVAFVYRVRPDIMGSVQQGGLMREFPLRTLLIVILAVATVTGGGLSWFASGHPDGLEWSIARVTGSTELPEARDREHQVFTVLQDKIVLLPGYTLPGGAQGRSAGDASPREERIGRSLAGLVGGAVTLMLCLLAGLLCRKRTLPGDLRPGRGS
jgi:cobalt/nickel transport system permease protein